MVDETTGSNRQPTADHDEEEVEFVTKDELVEAVSKIVNSAISSRNKSFEKKFEDFMTKFSEPQKQPEKEEKVQNSELLRMKKELETLRSERDAEIAKRKDTDLRNNLKEQLTKAGVPSHLLKAAVATLNEDKLIGYDETDQLVFRTSTGDIDLTSGIKSWTKSEDGKAFLSPKGTVGSGDRNYNLSKNTPKLTDADLADLLVRHREQG